MRFERNDYKIDSRTAEAGPKTFDRRTGSFCQSRRTEAGAPSVKAGQEIVRDWSGELWK